jgi:hypothetical protein
LIWICERTICRYNQRFVKVELRDNSVGGGGGGGGETICEVGGSGGGGHRSVRIITEKELVYRALLGDLLSPTQKAKLGAGDTAAAEEV